MEPSLARQLGAEVLHLCVKLGRVSALEAPGEVVAITRTTARPLCTGSCQGSMCLGSRAVSVPVPSMDLGSSVCSAEVRICLSSHRPLWITAKLTRKTTFFF